MKEKAKLTEAEIERLLTAEFPQMFNPQGGFAIDAVWFRGCRVRKRFDPQSLRPGGTIAGTTMMALADLGPYVAIHASIGWAPMAVTTNLSINFLKRPAQRRSFGGNETDQARQTPRGGRYRYTLRRRG
jgi:acyl-coenzyme A thioesterase PaaI-like protein